jgi:hypothetical protein
MLDNVAIKADAIAVYRWMSWPQLVVFGVGILAGLLGYLGIPVWFVFLGRYLGSAVG